jgi:hypothetical protein
MGPRPRSVVNKSVDLGGGTFTLSNMCSNVKPSSSEPTRKPFLYSEDVRKGIRFRPPGLKPTTKVGSLGPYRGRLGFAWVVAPIVAGVVILLAGWLLLR